jgi:hypothetical protein
VKQRAGILQRAFERGCVAQIALHDLELRLGEVDP